MVIGVNKLTKEERRAFIQEAGFDKNGNNVIFSCGAVSVNLDKDMADALMTEGFFELKEAKDMGNGVVSVQATINKDKTNGR